MLLKIKARMRIAILAIGLLASCRSGVPWANEPLGNEINLAFTVENNLVFLSTIRINGRPGRYFLGSAHRRSVLDASLAPSLGGRLRLQLTEKDSAPLSPVILDLGGIGEAIVGADVWGNEAITIDYKAGLVTYQKKGMRSDMMTLFSFAAEPAVTISVDGETRSAVVDTASPDTLILPAREAMERTTARVILGGVDFGEIDVRYADIAQARIGNRVLSKFLVTIDYGRRQVGLWRDPRIPL